MRLHVKGKNVEVSDSIRRYAEEKLAKLDRQLHELRQVEHYRAKRSRKQARGNGIPPPGGPMSIPNQEQSPQIVKTKQFAVKPMTAEEAVLQLELVGHDFFVFQNDESGKINVPYRRKDGGYGLIEPQM